MADVRSLRRHWRNVGVDWQTARTTQKEADDFIDDDDDDHERFASTHFLLSGEPEVRPRPLCRSAVVALVWVLLTTPATTLPLLFALDHPGSPLKRLEPKLSAFGMTSLVGVVLIGLPLLGAIIASFALGRTRASWTPVRGGDLARIALLIGILATISGAWIFVAALRN
ncbi:MAG TPA: hypothetical protein VFV83_06530 [Chthoniobacteraceae bacterium]|nr:hypothetical protein [Chthoniobacteraceae bacterium]